MSDAQGFNRVAEISRLLETDDTRVGEVWRREQQGASIAEIAPRRCGVESSVVVAHSHGETVTVLAQFDVESVGLAVLEGVRASAMVKYTAPSSSSGRRIARSEAPDRMATGTGCRPASVSLATISPRSLSTDGWMPCATSRRSASTRRRPSRTASRSSPTAVGSCSNPGARVRPAR